MKKTVVLLLMSFVFGTTIGGTLYLSNKTPYTLKYHVGYKVGLVCPNDEGYVQPNAVATVGTSACKTDNIWGAIYYGKDANGKDIVGRFVKYTLTSVNSGTFTFYADQDQHGVYITTVHGD